MELLMAALGSLLDAGPENALGNSDDQFDSAVGLDIQGSDDGFKGANKNATNKHEFSRSHGDKRVCLQFSA